MKPRFVAGLIALLLCSQLGACVFIRSKRPVTSQLPPAGSTGSRPNYPPAASGEPLEVHDNPTVPAEPSTAIPATAPANTLNVTIDDSDANHFRAQTLLDQADAQLARVDHSTLTADRSAVFKQASVLADAARKAMKQHDYLAASGLARKSVLLTGHLSSGTAPRKSESSK
jgi:hypothetical protein